MSDQLVRRPARWLARTTFAEHVFGTSSDQSLPALKMGLHAAGLLESPADKIDLVMLEDYEHLTELVAEEGVPLAYEAEVVVREVRYVKVRMQLHWLVLLLLLVLGIMAGGENIFWDLFPG